MAAPTITSFSPAKIPANAGGQTTATGTGFDTATAVTVNGVAATFSATNATTLVITIPNTVAGVASVKVTNPDGNVTDTTHLTISSYVFDKYSAEVPLTGTFQTSGTGIIDIEDNYEYADKPLFNQTYPSTDAQYLKRVALIKAVNLYNTRYPDTPISPVPHL